MLRFFLLTMVLFSVASIGKAKDDGSQIQAGNYFPRVKIETSMGDFVIELDRSRAPISTNNFLRYVDKRSYEGTIFHRVVVDFVVQGGGYDRNFVEKPSFPQIINESGNGLKNERYTVAMARQDDPHTANRQFFINVNDNVSLDPGKEWGYAVFGYVFEGSETLDTISQVKTDFDPTYGWADVPIEPIILKRASVLPQF
ncbi:MAG: peptidyl-prolyl cis-trans isomerase A (cyclophilin A) [Paraglaciecola sp.]|jgi:peptidyl-prolyl cis-trans isomerase A (cyclophilin A)